MTQTRITHFLKFKNKSNQWKPPSYIFYKLSKSNFRSKFKLGEKEIKIVREKSDKLEYIKLE